MRKVRPYIIVVGSLPAQIIWRIDYDFNKNEPLTYPRTWELALDPSKWGLRVSRWWLQCEIGKARGALLKNINYCGEPKPELLKKYFPGITNPKFQEVFPSWIKKQLEVGVDAVQNDILFMQTRIMMKLTQDSSNK